MRKNAARKININAMQKLQKWGQFPLKKLDLRVHFGGGAGFIGGLVWARIYVRQCRNRNRDDAMSQFHLDPHRHKTAMAMFPRFCEA